MKFINTTVKSNFVNDLKECLVTNPPTFKYKFDNFMWIAGKISYMIKKNAFMKGLKLVPISSTIIRNEIGADYPLYIQYMVQHQFIRTDNHYITSDKCKMGSGKCKCYNYTDRYVENQEEIYKIKKKSLIKRKKKWMSQMKEKVDKSPKLSGMYDLMGTFSIDLEEALEYLRSEFELGNITETQYQIEVDKCKRINDGEIFMTQDDYGRVHTNFTNLKRNVRDKFIKLNGENLVGIDIQSSQPATLYSMLYDFNEESKAYKAKGKFAINEKMQRKQFKIQNDPRNKYLNNTNSKIGELELSDGIYLEPRKLGYPSFNQYFEEFDKELERFKTILQSDIYDYFMDQWNYKHNTDITRENAKKYWYIYAFGKSNRPIHKKIHDFWYDEFPLITNIMDRIKENDHKLLAHILQRRESDIVINQLCSEVDEKLGVPYFTVHDSIYVVDRPGVVEETKSIFRTILDKNNIVTGI